MNRNSILAVVGVLGIALGALGLWLYQDQNRNRIELNVGGRGIILETR